MWSSWSKMIECAERLADVPVETSGSDLLALIDDATSASQQGSVPGKGWQKADLNLLCEWLLEIMDVLQDRNVLDIGFDVGLDDRIDDSIDKTREAGLASLVIQLRTRLFRMLFPSARLQVLREDPEAWCDRSRLPSHFRIQEAISKHALPAPRGSVSARRVADRHDDTFERFLATSHSLVVLGEPGSGKSWSLARYVHLLFRRLASHDAAGPCWIPVYLSVGDVVPANSPDADPPSPRTMIATVLCKQIALEWLVAEASFVQWLLRVGAFFLVFDGLNEVPSERRDTFAKTLRALRKQYPHTRVVLASRKRQWRWERDLQAFGDRATVIEVVPLTDQQVIDFVMRVFRDEVAAEGYGLLQLLRVKVPSGREPVRDDIGQHEREEEKIRTLRNNPFFLDKIIRVYRSLPATQKGLPANRGDLFRNYIVLEAKDRSWFALQVWMLSVIGLQLTYAEETEVGRMWENILFAAFCTARTDDLVMGRPFLFRRNYVRGEAPLLAPVDIDGLVRSAGERPLWKEPAGAVLMERFTLRPPTVVKKFQRVLETILKNAFFESVGQGSSFPHQSLQEYFAAERFAVLYRADPEAYSSSMAHLPDFLRLRRYDDMLHIAVGCVFQDEQEYVQRILQRLLDGGRFDDLNEFLDRTEFVEPEGSTQLRGGTMAFIQEQRGPDEMQGAALRCLCHVHLQATVDDQESILFDGHLHEGPIAWAALLDLARDLDPARGAFEIRFKRAFEARTRHLDAAPEARQKELVQWTMKWVEKQEREYLHEYLVDVAFEKLLVSAIDNVFASTCWAFVSRAGILRLTPRQWGRLLDHVDDPELYSRILSYDHDQRSDFLCRYFSTDAKLLQQVRRWQRPVPFWWRPLAALLRVQRAREGNSADVLMAVLEVCSKQGDYPSALMDELFAFDVNEIYRAKVDQVYLPWVAQKSHHLRPSRLGRWLQRLVNDAQTSTRASFSRSLRHLTDVAVTSEVALARAMVDTVVQTAASANNELARYYHRLLSCSHADLLTEVGAFRKRAGRHHQALLVVLRKRSQELADDDLMDYWKRDLHGGLFNLLFIGGGTDRFVRNRPDRIRDAVSNEEKLLGKDAEIKKAYLRRFSPISGSYSTFITLYVTLSGTRLGGLMATPKAPSPTPWPASSTAFVSLLRLLRYRMTEEASFLLFEKDTLLSKLRKHLASEAPDLVEALEAARAAALLLGRSESKTPEPVGVTDAALVDLPTLERLANGRALLRFWQVPKVLDALLEAGDGWHALRLAILKRAKAWKQAGRLDAAWDEQRVSMAMDLGFFAEDTLRSLRVFRARKTLTIGDSLDDEALEKAIAAVSTAAPPTRIPVKSFGDRRSVFFWQLLWRPPAWTGEEHLDTLAQMCAALPVDLRRTLLEELVGYVGLTDRTGYPTWWLALVLKTIGTVKVSGVDEARFEAFVDGVLRSSLATATEFRDVVVKAVVGVTSKDNVHRLQVCFMKRAKSETRRTQVDEVCMGIIKLVEPKFKIRIVLA